MFIGRKSITSKNSHCTQGQTSSIIHTFHNGQFEPFYSHSIGIPAAQEFHNIVKQKMILAHEDWRTQ